ncbi:MAG: CARDB domain-containing protein [Thermoplasmatales archaeon]|nr:CARDB domain-containing protein [Thermoplasmatales archaeon]
MRIRKIVLIAGAALLVLVLLMILSSKVTAERVKATPTDDLTDDLKADITDNHDIGINIADVANGVADKVEQIQTSDKLLSGNALKPDLTIKNVVFIESPKCGDVVTVHLSVKNVGSIPAMNVKTGFYIDNKEIETKNVMSIRKDDVTELTFSWKAETGEHSLMVYADPYEEIDEINENNNMYAATLNVAGEGGQNMVGSEPPPIISKDAGAVVAAVGAVSMLALLGLYSDKYRFFTLFAPLYTRIKKKHVLDHFTRGRIYGYIESNPGAHYNMLRESLGLNNGSLAYHLRMLEKTEYVISRKAGKCRYFYPSSVNISRKNGLSNLQNSILEKIVEAPDITQKEIADETGVSQQVISYNVKKMIKNGVVKTKKNGRESYIYVAESFGA